MSNEPEKLGTLDLLRTGEVIVHLNDKPPFKLSHLQAIDVYEVVREQARLDQRRRDREKLVRERIANVAYRPVVGLIEVEDE